MCKQISSNKLLKRVTNKLFAYQSLSHTHKDLIFNNPQELICHKIPTNQLTRNIFRYWLMILVLIGRRAFRVMSPGAFLLGGVNSGRTLVILLFRCSTKNVFLSDFNSDISFNYIVKK